MFCVNYDPNDNGRIISYQEAPDHTHNQVPEGCKTLYFANPIPEMVQWPGRTMMRVDLKTGKLVYLNPVEIPDPLPNPPNAAT